MSASKSHTSYSIINDQTTRVKVLPRKKNVGMRARLGKGFHSSETKVIDNAIVGFVLEDLKQWRK